MRHTAVGRVVDGGVRGLRCDLHLLGRLVETAIHAETCIGHPSGKHLVVGWIGRARRGSREIADACRHADCRFHIHSPSHQLGHQQHVAEIIRVVQAMNGQHVVAVHEQVGMLADVEIDVVHGLRVPTGRGGRGGEPRGVGGCVILGNLDAVQVGDKTVVVLQSQRQVRDGRGIRQAKRIARIDGVRFRGQLGHELADEIAAIVGPGFQPQRRRARRKAVDQRVKSQLHPDAVNLGAAGNGVAALAAGAHQRQTLSHSVRDVRQLFRKILATQAVLGNHRIVRRNQSDIPATAPQREVGVQIAAGIDVGAVFLPRRKHDQIVAWINRDAGKRPSVQPPGIVGQVIPLQIDRCIVRIEDLDPVRCTPVAVLESAVIASQKLADHHLCRQQLSRLEPFQPEVHVPHGAVSSVDSPESGDAGEAVDGCCPTLESRATLCCPTVESRATSVAFHHASPLGHHAPRVAF